MALLPAVVVSQAPGLGGVPSTGHFSKATRSASLAASSAMSMSPKRRTSEATTRPYSSRKIRSIADAGSRHSGSGWNGRTSTLPAQALEPSSAHLSAASRSGASMIQKPPRYSFDSAYGPSVTIGLSPVLSTVVAWSTGWRPPAKTQAPSARTLSLNASTSANDLLHLLLGHVGEVLVRAVNGQQVLGHDVLLR